MGISDEESPIPVVTGLRVVSSEGVDTLAVEQIDQCRSDAQSKALGKRVLFLAADLVFLGLVIHWLTSLEE